MTTTDTTQGDDDMNVPVSPSDKQDKLIAFIRDPETINKAVEGSMDKRLAKLDTTSELKRKLNIIVMANYPSTTASPQFLEDMLALLAAQKQRWEVESEIGWKIQLPNLPYFQIKAFDTEQHEWVSPIYNTENLPAALDGVIGENNGQ